MQVNHSYYNQSNKHILKALFIKVLKLKQMLTKLFGFCLMLLGLRFWVQEGLCLFISATCCLHTLSHSIQRNSSLYQRQAGEGKAIRLIANVVHLLAPSKTRLLLFLTNILIPNVILECINSNNAKHFQEGIKTIFLVNSLKNYKQKVQWGKAFSMKHALQ